MTCHRCPETERAARGCSKPIADPGLAAQRDQADRTCPVDLEVEDWYWRALQDSTLLEAGHLTLEDMSWADYVVACEVSSERARIESARARSRR